MSLLYTPSLLEAARSATGFLGNPDLHKKVAWGKLSNSETNTYIATHVAKRDAALPFSIIGTIEPSDKMYLHGLGNWSPTYSSAADLVKSKLSFLLGAPEDPLLSQFFATAAENITKIEAKSPFSANTSIAKSVANNRPITFRMSSPMFVKKDEPIDSGKPKGFEHIEYNFKAMEEEWVDSLASQDAKKMWMNTIKDHHLNPLNAWDTEGDFYVPPDYTSVLPSALVEVHFEIRMHKFTKGRTFSTQINQIIVWVEGEPVVPCDGNPFSRSHTGPYRYILDDDEDDTNKEDHDNHIERVQEQEADAEYMEKDAHDSEEQPEEYEHIEAPQPEAEEEEADVDAEPIERATTPPPAAVAVKAPVTPMKKLAVATPANTPSTNTTKTSPAKRSIRAVQDVQSAEGSPPKRATIKVRPQAATGTSPAEAAKSRNSAKKANR